MKANDVQGVLLQYFQDEDVVKSTDFLTKETSLRFDGGIPPFLPDRAIILGDL